jgi:hypothetical protein
MHRTQIFIKLDGHCGATLFLFFFFFVPASSSSFFVLLRSSFFFFPHGLFLLCVCVLFLLFRVCFARAQSPTLKATINGPGLYGAADLHGKEPTTLYIGNSEHVRDRNRDKKYACCVFRC